MEEQLTAEWFAKRTGRATASRFKDILAGGRGITRKKYLMQVALERLTGNRRETYTSYAMQQGIENEGLARRLYEALEDVEVEQVGFMEIDGIKAGASPDGLVSTDGMVEIKCPEDIAHAETLTKKTIPTTYIPQVQGQMWATGRKWCDYVSFNPDWPPKYRIIIIRVHRDDSYIDNILKPAVIQFLADVESEVSKWS